MEKKLTKPKLVRRTKGLLPDIAEQCLKNELDGDLSEIFEALKKLSSGDPSVRLPETSQFELITRLKHMVNVTAQDLAEIVDLSHEFAIGLAEHFDVLSRVSQGELSARITGISQVELLDTLKKVTNQMIHSISKEISARRSAEQHIRALGRQLMMVQERERQRLSSDLHDHLAQDLSTLKFGLDTLFDSQRDVSVETRQKVSELAKGLQEATITVRNLAYELRPASLDQLGLVQSLREHCEEVSTKNGLKITFFSAGIDESKLHGDTKISIYRIIQESLNNIKKHANASHVIVRLIASFPKVIVRIEDDGKGFNVPGRLTEALNEKRMGLRSMEERVALLQGSMRIESGPMRGTSIAIEIPIREKNDGQEDYLSGG
jgi:signal transduction histidine kinase